MKVVQTVFAYFFSDGHTPSQARKQLLESIANSYDLYLLLLDLIHEITVYAAEYAYTERERHKIMHLPYVEKRNFIDNKFAAQLFENASLRKLLQERKLSWDSEHLFIEELHKSFLENKEFQNYLESASPSYTDDKTIWHNLFRDVISVHPLLDTTLEDVEFALKKNCWSDDINAILFFVLKTIRFFHQSRGAAQPLLPLFKQEADRDFALSLLNLSTEHFVDFEKLLKNYYRNWDAERVAYIDKVILIVALTEIRYFDDIPIEVSFNEYIEIAKQYSARKSFMFVNGILNEVLSDWKKEDIIVKNLK